MPSTRDLRRRIKSIKNTSQITKAMQMVSATKMRRSQNQTLASRPYVETLAIAVSLISQDKTLTHNLLIPNSSTKVAILLLTSDKGLCGGLNTNLFRYFNSLEQFNGKEVTFYSIGRKGRDYVVRTGKNLDADFESQERVDFSHAIKIRQFMVLEFINNKIGQAYLLYPHFISTLKQDPRLEQLLPINLNKQSEELVNQPKIDQSKLNYEFLFEPNKQEVLEYALIHLLETKIYQALIETKASEHSARMIAMKNATDNALELVDEITLTYNQARQENITKELLEIASAGSALE